MDPLSITTACLGAIGTISKVSLEIPLFISSVREARRDMEAVLRELTSLTLCLGALHDDAQKVTFPTTLLAVVQSCDQIAGQIISLLDRLKLKKSGRIRWTLTEREEVNKLRSSLESHKSCIDVALDMATIQLLAAVREDTNEIRDATIAIKADTEDIKQDTQQINSLVQEIAFLRLQVSQLRQESGSAGITLQRFLDETSSYAESAVDVADLAEVDPDETRSLSVISEEESDIDRTEQPRGPTQLPSEAHEADTQHPPDSKPRPDHQFEKSDQTAWTDFEFDANNRAELGKLFKTMEKSWTGTISNVLESTPNDKKDDLDYFIMEVSRREPAEAQGHK